MAHQKTAGSSLGPTCYNAFMFCPEPSCFARCGLTLPAVSAGCPREGDHRDLDSLEEPSSCSRPGVPSGIRCQCAAHLPWGLATCQSCRRPRAQHPFQHKVGSSQPIYITSEAVLQEDHLRAADQQ